MRIIIFIIFSFPYILNCQDIDLIHYNKVNRSIDFSTNMLLESDDISYEFINTMLYGGFITDEMKTNWINNGNLNNGVNVLINNSIKYSNYIKDGLLSFSINDVSSLDSRITDDLLKLTLEGNFKYQDQILDISNSFLRLNRYQQYKIEYLKYYNNNDLKNEILINTGISYIVGNMNKSYIINNGSIYTHPDGSIIDLKYEFESIETNTSLFASNGQGLSFDFGLTYEKSNDIIGFNIFDIGYIQWNENTKINKIDSTFSFSGIQFNDFDEVMDFTDSLTHLYNQHISQHQFNNMKSFLASKIYFKYFKKINLKSIKEVRTSIQLRWQPYNFNNNINLNLIKKGFRESGYSPKVNIYTLLNIENINIMPGISTGGYNENLSFHLNISNKKESITFGVYFIESLFNKEKLSLGSNIRFSKRF